MSEAHDRHMIALMAEQIRTQDNAITAEPIFMVQRCMRNHGIDTNYTDNAVWMHPGGDEVEPDLCSALDEWDHGYGRTWTEQDIEKWGNPNQYTLTGYADRWENVQPFFTRAGAEHYIEINGHNLRGPEPPRIFV